MATFERKIVLFLRIYGSLRYSHEQLPKLTVCTIFTLILNYAKNLLFVILNFSHIIT